MNATTTTANANQAKSQSNLVALMFQVIGLFIYVFNYNRLVLFTSDLITKFNKKIMTMTSPHGIMMDYVMKIICRFTGFKVEDDKSNEEEEDEEEEEEDAILDPELWYDLPNYKDNHKRQHKYKGEWKNNLPNGKGTMKFIHDRDKALTSTLECTFVDGYANGYGRQIFERTHEPMVPYYEGEIRNNFQHGKGEYYYGNGSYYKGEFVDGKFQGQGIEYCHIRKQTFVGEFYNDGQLKGVWKQGQVEN